MQVEREKNRTKSQVCSKVEHVFAVLKLTFGFVKVRYRGVAKNANRLFTAFAQVNLFMVRKRLLPNSGALSFAAFARRFGAQQTPNYHPETD